MIMMYNPSLTRTIKTRLQEMYLDYDNSCQRFITKMRLPEELWSFQDASPDIYQLNDFLASVFLNNDGYSLLPISSHSMAGGCSDSQCFSRPHEMYRFINDTTFFYLTVKTVPIYKSFKSFIAQKFSEVLHEISINLIGCNCTEIELIRIFPTSIRFSKLMKYEAQRVIDSFYDLDFDAPTNEVIELLNKHGFIESDDCLISKCIELTAKRDNWTTRDSEAKEQSNEIWSRVMKYHINRSLGVQGF